MGLLLRGWDDISTSWSDGVREIIEDPKSSWEQKQEGQAQNFQCPYSVDGRLMTICKYRHSTEIQSTADITATNRHLTVAVLKVAEDGTVYTFIRRRT